MNTADYLLENGRDQDVVMVASERQYTYQDLRETVRKMIGVLQQAGIQPGVPVGIIGANSIFWAAAYLAVMKLNAIAVPLPTTVSADELKRMAQVAHLGTILADRVNKRKFFTALPEPMQWIEETALEAAPLVPMPEVEPADVTADAAWMLTSGTTALPRVVRITHRNLQANTNSIITYLELTAAERMMSILPFHYCFGTSLLHTHLRVGGSLTLAKSFIYPEVILNQIEETQCTGFAGVPSNYQTLLRNSTFMKRQVRCLHKAQQAGGKLPDVLIKELRAALPNGQLYVMYGQTEATARLSYLPPSLLDTKLGSIGKGIPGVTLKVIHEEGREINPGEVGEIYAWGENISPGYLEDPESNAQKFVDGALHTGDLATVDEDGYIYVVDRKADFIKSYGYRVSSQQVEACILEQTDVVAAAVIGEPDMTRGEAILAFIVLKDGATLTAPEIINYCGQHLAHHMVPRDIYFVPRLPLNTNGKVVKNELRELIKNKSQKTE